VRAGLRERPYDGMIITMRIAAGRLASICALTGALISAAGCHSRPAEELMEQGLDDFRQSRYGRAARSFSAAAQADPEAAPDALLFLGHTLLFNSNQPDPDGARRRYAEVIRRFPDAPAADLARFYTAVAYEFDLRAFSYEDPASTVPKMEAAALYDELARDLGETDLGDRAAYRAAVCYETALAEADTDEAVRRYEKLLSAHPDSYWAGRACSRLAELCDSRPGDTEAARRYYRIYLDRYPDVDNDSKLHFYHYRVGRLSEELGDRDTAIEYYTRVLTGWSESSWEDRVRDRLEAMGVLERETYEASLGHDEERVLPENVQGSIPPDRRATIRIGYWLGHHPGWEEGLREVTERYRERHPNVKFILIYQPHKGYDTWVMTQLLGGVAPDLIQMFVTSAVQYGARKGLLVPLARFLHEENPYNPGKAWIDTFYSPVLVDNRNADPVFHEYWTIPYGVVSVRMYYNADIFRKLNLAIPNTWAEFLQVQKVVQEAGIIPLTVSNSPVPVTSGWMQGFLSNMVLDSLTERVDVRVPDSGIDAIEMYAAIRDGLIAYDDPELWEPLRLIGDCAKYWGPGFNGMDWEQSKRVFYQGRAAMMMDGSWEMTGAKEKIAGKFEYGIFRIPTVTEETSPYADDMMLETAPSAGLEFAVSKDCERRGDLDVAVDFMRFFTAPQNLEVMTRHAYNIPIVPGTAMNPEVEIFRPQPRGGQHPSWFITYTPMRDAFVSDVRLFFEGRKTLKQVQDEFRDTYFRYIDEHLRAIVRDQKVAVSRVWLRLAEEEYRAAHAGDEAGRQVRLTAATRHRDTIIDGLQQIQFIYERFMAKDQM